MLMTAIGESPPMRAVADYPSQYFNKKFKDHVLKPFSDSLLYIRSSYDYKEPTEFSLEYLRQSLRFSLRLLSMSNITKTPDERKSLADNHCKAILSEVTKIFSLNIEKFCNKHNLSKKDIQEIEKFLPKYNDDLTVDQMLDETEKSEVVEGLLHHIIGGLDDISDESINLDNIMLIYDDGVAEVKEKRDIFYDDIKESEALIDNGDYDRQEIETLYVTSRLIYVAGVIAVAYAINVLFAYLKDDSKEEELDVKKELDDLDDEYSFIKDHANTIFSKQIFKSALGHAFNLYQRYNKRTTNGYVVPLDTELHDYPKFVVRIISLFSLMFVHDQINEHDDEVHKTLKKGVHDKAEGIIFGAEVKTKLLKSILRFLSGSHVAMRMEIKEKIIDPIIDSISELLKDDKRFLNLMSDISGEIAKQNDVFDEILIIKNHNRKYSITPSTNIKIDKEEVEKEIENNSREIQR